MKSCALSLVVCVLWFMSGCATPRHSSRSTDEKDVSQVVEILYDFYHVKNLSTKEMYRQYTIQEKHYQTYPNSKNSLMLSLLLTIPNTKFHDTSRAIHILNSFMSSYTKKDDSIARLTSLIMHMMAEQKDQESKNTKIIKKLHKTIEEKDEKERLYETTSQKLNTVMDEIKRQESLYNELNEKLGKEKKRAENLQQKIDQLKMIEKIINDRKNRKEPTT